MRLWALLLGTGTFLLALLLSKVMEKVATSTGMIDRPNARSSHTAPTPRGGGLAIVVSSVAAIAVVLVCRVVSDRIVIAIVGGGLAVALVGFLDDRRSLSAPIRLVVHLAAAAWAIAWIGPFLRFPDGVLLSGPMGYLVRALGVAWFLNIFNFMDGIDGLAASEAVFTCWAGVAIAVLLGRGTLGILPFVVGAAALGFLVRNWPPAKIFMGDIGSGYLGFVIAVLGLEAGMHGRYTVWTWVILAGAFVVDSTVTLTRRLVRGERLAVAHRTHAYQLAARRWGHKAVTVSIVLIDVLWLLPWAVASAVWPACTPWALGISLCPLVCFALALGAGRPEAAPG